MSEAPDNKKFAVTVEISGVPCRLIAAKDHGTGIIFFPHSAINYEYGNQSFPIKEEHITAWPNEASGKVHIHHTLSLDDQNIWKIDYSTLADNTEGDFAAAIYCCSISANNNIIPHKKNLNKYKYTQILGFYHNKNTLIICYAVADMANEFPDLSKYGISRSDIKLSNMKIALYYTYLNIFSHQRGRASILTTSMRRVNNSPVGQVAVVLKRMEDLTNSVKRQIKNVINSYISTVKNDLIQNIPENLEEINSFFENYTFTNTIIPLEYLKSYGITHTSDLWGPINFEDRP